MKQLGTQAFVGKYIQGASIKAGATRQKPKPEGVGRNEYVWELDAGLFTVAQLSKASGIAAQTIKQRLERGWRKYEMVTQPVIASGIMTDARKAFYKNKGRLDLNGSIIANERREYYKRLAAGHPKI